MATIPTPPATAAEVDYPDSDGRPMGETPLHRDNLAYLVEMLRTWFENHPQVYVSGNMFVYYVPGNRLRHVSPDVFVVFGVPKHTTPERRRYLIWEEAKAPDVVIELTSESTREEDIDDKLPIYRDLIGVREYFLFDPYEEHLDPPLQGYRLVEGQYQRIDAVAGRLPSEVLGLHFEHADGYLRPYDPVLGQRLLTPPEEHHALVQAEAELQQAETQRQQAEAERQREVEARRQAEAEVERLRQELEALRRQLPGPNP
jgi:Uma2 family endonuclease